MRLSIFSNIQSIDLITATTGKARNGYNVFTLQQRSKRCDHDFRAFFRDKQKITGSFRGHYSQEHHFEGLEAITSTLSLLYSSINSIYRKVSTLWEQKSQDLLMIKKNLKNDFLLSI